MSPKKRLIESEYETWDFYIDNWDHNYLFSTNKVRGREGYFDESRHFTLYCTVTYPDHYQKGCAAQLRFIPNRNIDASLVSDARYDNPPTVVGSFSTRKNNMCAYVNIPWQSSANVLQLLSNGIFKYVQLHGRRMKRRGIEVSTMMFARNDPEA